MTTDWNSSILVPPLDIKNYPPDGWNAWFNQFKVRALVTTFPRLPDPEKVAVLLLKLGDEVTHIFETFNVEVDKVGYDEIVQLFSEYFTPLKARYVFLNANQKAGETFDHFAKRLAMLSYPCCFGPFHDGLLRDLFLSNMNAMYANIRDKILKNHRDPSFQEVLSFSNALWFEGCNVASSGRSVSSNDRTTITVLSGDSAHRVDSNVTNDVCNIIKDKERDLDSLSPELNSMDLHNFKTPRSQAPLPRNQFPELRNSRPATRDNRKGTSLKLASALKNAIGNNSTKSSPTFAGTEAPKLNFAFKCFSNEGAHSRDGLSDTELLSRITSIALDKEMKESNAINSSQSQQPLNLSFADKNRDKPSGVSARLNKFGNKGVLGALEKSRISSERVCDKNSYDRLNTNLSSKPQNDLSENRSCQRDSEVSSYGDNRQATDSCIDDVSTRSGISQKPSNHNMNTRASKPENYGGMVKPVENEMLFGMDRMRSEIAAPTQSMDGELFTSDKADDRVTQTYSIGATGLNWGLNPKPDPPVSKNCFSEVVIVFISENDDTIYVCPVVKYQYLETIESELKKLFERNALQPISNIKIGEKYAAPFKGDWYRAEIIAANIKKKTGSISFCDYGNEEDIPLSDLRLLPEEFQELEPLSFPIRLPKGAPEIRSGSKLKIRPLSLEEDWSWAVELRTNQR